MEDQKRVYVVEDEEEICQRILKYLTNEGYDVTCFHRGDNALEEILKNQPDLLVLDIKLPGIDGIRILSVSMTIRTAIDSSKILVMKKEITVTASCDNEKVKAFGDNRRIVQALQNLVNNALVHNPPGIEIHLSSKKENDRVLFTVEDNGKEIVSAHGSSIAVCCSGSRKAFVFSLPLARDEVKMENREELILSLK